MSPKVPKAYLEARRTEILEAAAKCFMNKGFHNTTMQDIYKDTNLSPGAIYNYFKSKEDIVDAAVEMSQQRNLTMINEAVSANEEEALVKLGQLLFSFASQIDLAKAASVDFALYSEANRNKRIRETMRKGQNAVINKLTDLVKYNQRAGIFNERLNARSVAQVLVSVILGFEIHILLDPDLDLESYLEVYKAMVNGTFSRTRNQTEDGT